MENSYRFLMIAATILLGILLLTTFVYVFSAGANASKARDEAQETLQITAENQKYEVYNRSTNTISDVISLASLIYNNNKEADFNDEEYCKELIIKIGTSNQKEYRIPKKLSGYSIDSDCFMKNELPDLVNIGNKTKVSQVILQTKPGTVKIVSIYDLLTSKKISKGEKFYNPQKRQEIFCNEEASLSETRFDNATSQTLYKFLFDCSEIKYSASNGRVESMTLTAYLNGNYDL